MVDASNCFLHAWILVFSKHGMITSLHKEEWCGVLNSSVILLLEFYTYDLIRVPKINVRENQWANQEWTIKKHWQYWVHRIQYEETQNAKHTT